MSPEHPISLIVGLGNPGAEYENTRHNAGTWLVNQLAVQENQSLRFENKFHGSIATIKVANQCHTQRISSYDAVSAQASSGMYQDRHEQGVKPITKSGLERRKVYLFIPTTFMNNSGPAVCAVAKFYKIAPENILLAHDEIDLPPGIVRLKFAGGHGGHNGLRDIFKALGTQNFYRLRIGVGRPKYSSDVVDYVLKRPNKSEQTQIDNAIDDALRVMPDIILGNIQQAMKNLHTKSEGK